MEAPRDWPLEQVIGLREEMGELRANVAHLGTDLSQLRQDVRGEFADVRLDLRRLDGRAFQLLLAQLATLATALGALVAALAA